ncbi:hypothetical protein KCU62_g32, partial [Aureobasidium sp. EXF-3399]
MHARCAIGALHRGYIRFLLSLASKGVQHCNSYKHVLSIPTTPEHYNIYISLCRAVDPRCLAQRRKTNVTSRSQPQDISSYARWSEVKFQDSHDTNASNISPTLKMPIRKISERRVGKHRQGPCEGLRLLDPAIDKRTKYIGIQEMHTDSGFHNIVEVPEAYYMLEADENTFVYAPPLPQTFVDNGERARVNDL